MSLNELETVQVLKDAMRRYAVNTISPSSLGIFMGIEDGVDVTMRLDGGNLRITKAEKVDVTGYEQTIEGLEETVKELKGEVASLKKAQKTPKKKYKVVETSIEDANKGGQFIEPPAISEESE